MIRVALYPADKYACGHYRMVWPGQGVAAQETDVEVTIVPPGSETGIVARKDLLTGEFSEAFGPDGYDVLVLQRPCRKFTADAVPLLREKGVAVVIDLDDDLERIHPGNTGAAGVHPETSPDYNWQHLKRACRHATLVTVSTPALMPRYAPHGRVRLLRNCVPRRFLDIPHDPSLDTVGWAGSLHSHPDDLDQAASALARLAGEGHELKFVGPGEGVERKLGLRLQEGVFTGNLKFGSWVQAIASRIGVGVAPVAHTVFNEAKSWLKPLEYAAAGVPFVSSGTAEYLLFASRCGAPTAGRPRDWYRHLKTLLSSEDARAEASGRGRETAAALTVEGHAHKWAEAWLDAVKIERATARSGTTSFRL